MSNFPKVAKEQGQKFYEDVAKSAINKRFIVREYIMQNGAEKIYTVEDTILGMHFHYCFDTREAAEIQCTIFNAKRKKPGKRSKRKEQE